LSDDRDCLPIIRCSCGFELLLLPDVQVMGQAIEKHALEHAKKYGLTQEQTESLKEYLIAQAFKLASEKPKQEYYKKSVEH
jgi:hypothetical protein